MTEQNPETTVTLEDRAYNYAWILGATMIASVNEDASALPAAEHLQVLAIGILRDPEAMEIVKDTLELEYIPTVAEIANTMNMAGFRGESQSFARSVRHVMSTIDTSRDSDDFFSLPDSMRNTVYNELTDAMLAGEVLDKDEYDLLGWALGNETGSAKPTVSQDGASYLEFVQAINDKNPGSAAKLTESSADALREIPLSEWGTKAFVGGVIGPVVVSAAWIGPMAATVGAAGGVSMTSALISRLSAPLIAAGISKAQSAMIAIRSFATGVPQSQIIFDMQSAAMNPKTVEGVIAGRSWFSAATRILALEAAAATVFEVGKNAINPEAGAEADAEAIRKYNAQVSRGEAHEAFDEELLERIDKQQALTHVEAGLAPPQQTSQPNLGQVPDSIYQAGRYNREGSDFFDRNGLTVDDGGPAEAPGIVTTKDADGNDRRFEINGATTVADVEAMMVTVDTEEDLNENPLLGRPEGSPPVSVDRQSAQYDAQRSTGPGVYDFATASTNAVGGLAERQQQNIAVPATYRLSDIRDTIFNMTPVQLEQYQRVAVDAGLINDNDATFLYGSPDEQSMEAMSIIMSHSNNTGRTWVSQVEIMAASWQAKLANAELENAEQAPIKPLFVPNAPYVKMDPESVRQKIQDDVERQLGRSANDWEMSAIARDMEANHRANYDQKVVGERALFEARGRARMGEDPGALPVLEEIDEEAAYQAKFEERYETELDETDRWERQKRDTANLFRSFDVMSSQMGGV